jgi:uncharacterized protein DUF1329
MKRSLVRLLAIGLLFVLPSLGRTQSTDRSEMDSWVKDTASQGTEPAGGKITMTNWARYKQFMPLGMQKLFEGTYYWKMPTDIEMDVGPAVYNTFLPKTWVEATEQYGPQTQVEVLPNGHYALRNYHGGTPFPNPQDPNKGWKVLANVFWAFQPSVYVQTPNNFGSIWSNDRFGHSKTTTIDVVYRWSDFNTDPGFPVQQTHAPGTWYTEWLMEETPEEARYTASLSLFYVDQEKNPLPDTFAFVPALRRSVRLASTARCSPVFGFDWSYDDAKTNGFNGSTSIYTADFLADRKLLTLAHFNQDGAVYPAGYLMPLGFPKPTWGKWEARAHAVVDVHRIPSESVGYCYSSRIIYADREHWNGNWVDLFDSNKKLWKAISYFHNAGDVPGLGSSLDGVASTAMDLQNSHETVWCGFGNPWKRKPYLDNAVPREYLDDVQYYSPPSMAFPMR